MPKLIPVAGGLFSILDDADYERFNSHRWHQARSRSRPGLIYARRFDCTRGRRSPKSIYLHREILGDAVGPVTDHINGDTLDNRRSNLRPATAALNAQNLRGPRRDSKTGSRGVGLVAATGKYRVRVAVGGRRIQIGTFDDLSDAHEAAAKARCRLMAYAPETGSGETT